MIIVVPTVDRGICHFRKATPELKLAVIAFYIRASKSPIVGDNLMSSAILPYRGGCRYCEIL